MKQQFIEQTAALRIGFQKFARDVSGATLVEYGVALLVVIIVGGATIAALGGEVGNQIQATTDAF
ncbi:MAG: Flp family type IVb pilin [Boseongicola sp.]|nr:MAG: Flp family type IVb pilin [Boseongicola sp.]